MFRVSGSSHNLKDELLCMDELRLEISRQLKAAAFMRVCPGEVGLCLPTSQSIFRKMTSLFSCPSSQTVFCFSEILWQPEP